MKRFRIVIAIFIIFLLAIVGATVYLAQGLETAHPVLSKAEHEALYASEENGWHEILEALRAIEVPSDELRQHLKTIRDDGKFSSQALEHLERQYEAIALAERGLEKEYSIVSRDYVLNYDLKHARALADALVWDAVRLEFENENDAAIQRYNQGLELGQRFMHGSEMIGCMIGVAIQAISIRALHDALPNFNEKQLEQIVSKLIEIEDARQPFGLIAAYDEALYYELPQHTIITRIRSRSSERYNARNSKLAYNQSLTEIIGTRLRAQVMLYERQTGKNVTSLEDVLGSNHVQIDPLTESPYIIDSEGAIRSTVPADEVLPNKLPKELELVF